MINILKSRNIKSGIVALLAIMLLFSLGCEKAPLDKASESIVFLGDSITSSYNLEYYFPDLTVINSGVWGDRTDNAHARLESDVYAHKPKKIFILLGINDMGYGRTNDDIAQRIETLISDIGENCPYSKIYLISVYPLNISDFDIWYPPMSENINTVVDDLNSKLVDLADDLDIEYVDVAQHLKNGNNELKNIYTVEGLHLTEAGYEVISEVLEGYWE